MWKACHYFGDFFVFRWLHESLFEESDLLDPWSHFRPYFFQWNNISFVFATFACVSGNTISTWILIILKTILTKMFFIKYIIHLLSSFHTDSFWNTPDRWFFKSLRNSYRKLTRIWQIKINYPYQCWIYSLFYLFLKMFWYLLIYLGNSNNCFFIYS